MNQKSTSYGLYTEMMLGWQQGSGLYRRFLLTADSRGLVLTWDGSTCLEEQNAKEVTADLQLTHHPSHSLGKSSLLFIGRDSDENLIWLWTYGKNYFRALCFQCPGHRFNLCSGNRSYELHSLEKNLPRATWWLSINTCVVKICRSTP